MNCCIHNQPGAGMCQSCAANAQNAQNVQNVQNQLQADLQSYLQNIAHQQGLNIIPRQLLDNGISFSEATKVQIETMKLKAIGTLVDFEREKNYQLLTEAMSKLDISDKEIMMILMDNGFDQKKVIEYLMEQLKRVVKLKSFM